MIYKTLFKGNVAGEIIFKKNRTINVGDSLDSFTDYWDNYTKTKLCPILMNTDKSGQLLKGIIHAFCSEAQVTTQIMYSNVFSFIYLHLDGKLIKRWRKQDIGRMTLFGIIICTLYLHLVDFTTVLSTKFGLELIFLSQII